MSQVKADAKGPTRAPRARPLSPHLQVWRWHVTMAASIATRASGVALYAALLIVAGWALALALGPDGYAGYMGLLGSPLGLLVLFAIAVSIFYHLAAGLRHLAFDSGKGFLPTTANLTAWLAFAFAVVAGGRGVPRRLHHGSLSMADNAFRTPLSRARGLGSAHSGAGRFISERATSVALVPLSLWAVWAALAVAHTGYDGAVAFLQSPVNAVMASLTVFVCALHMKMGMQVIIEDYVHQPRSKLPLLLLNSGVCWLAAAIGVFCILKVALLGAGVH